MIQLIFVLRHALEDYLLKTQLINVYLNVLLVLMLIQLRENAFRNVLEQRDSLLIQVIKDVLLNVH